MGECIIYCQNSITFESEWSVKNHSETTGIETGTGGHPKYESHLRYTIKHHHARSAPQSIWPSPLCTRNLHSNRKSHKGLHQHHH